MRYAIVDPQGNVVNAIELEGGMWEPPQGQLFIASDVASIGWTYDGVNFIPPPETPTDPVITAERARITSFRVEATQQDLIGRLQTATPAQIDAWLVNNVTTLAQARTVLGAIVKFLVARGLFR